MVTLRIIFTSCSATSDVAPVRECVGSHHSPHSRCVDVSRRIYPMFHLKRAKSLQATVAIGNLPQRP